VNLCIVGVLNHRDSAAENRDEVALHEDSVPLTARVALGALPDQIIQPRRIEPLAPLVEGNT
jgi:hypothetical protein